MRLGLVPVVVLCLAPAAGAGAEARCAAHDPLRQVFFGDLHVHTTYSLDAGTQGTRTTPAEAYRFARGERIGLHPFTADGRPLRSAELERPLDFAAVTDHAELFGELEICRDSRQPGHDSATCRVYRGWPRLAFFLMNSRGSPRSGLCGEDAARCRAAARGPWQIMQDAAADALDSSAECRFTSFVGAEWTQQGPGASNLHRNVLFRSGVVPERAPNAIDLPTKEALWDALERDCRREDGCEAVVIPHNSNLSAGLMFRTETSDGGPIDRAYAERRARFEPLVEIIQHKGASECRRSTAPEDELCGFEELPYDRFMGRYLPFTRQEAAPSSFARHALAAGLVSQSTLGANPFQFGLVGGTDTHLGTSGLVAEAADYPGHGGAGTPIGERVPDALLDPIEFNPGGLTALWAEENSRDALFRALVRREAYATSGPRFVLRMFGGFDLPEDLCERRSFAELGYGRGVPMGGELAKPAGRAPALAPAVAVWALADPGTASRPLIPLERIQIVKAWVENGAPRERVIDVARPGDAPVPPDETTCEPSRAGPSQLCRVWRDPDFDPAAPALYYARVLEQPTCRWSTRACSAAGIDCRRPETVRQGYADCCDPAWPRTVQERAWSSPIWYNPEEPR